MPTGYTAGILDGTVKTFEQFAKDCMRAFGATIHMRDEPSSKPYELRVPSTYDLENIKKAKEEIELYKSMPDADLIETEKTKLTESKSYHLKSIEKTKNDFSKLNALLNEAQNFKPPTPEHDNFKSFMIDQLQKTIEFDCNGNYHTEALQKIDDQLSNMDAEVIRAERIAESERSLAYHEKNYKEDVKRCNDANEWVHQLITSLNKPTK